MKAGVEIRTGIGLISAINVVMTFAVMGLLIRMSPAIERILEQNVSSITAVENMYAALAARDCGLSIADAEEKFDSALQVARANTFLEGESEIVAQVEAVWQPALAGECDARTRLATSLKSLADVNRLQMEMADSEAKLLGNAGAWATALLGMVSFGAGIFLTHRFTRRIAMPLSEIESVLSAAARGDPYRRCRRLEAPAEYGVIAVRLNQLLDRRLAHEETEDPQLKRIDRVLLLHLLDRMKEPALAVDTSGAILAASDGALEILASSGIESLSDALAVGPATMEEGISLIQRIEPFGKGDGFLITLRAPVPDESAPEGEGTVNLLDDEAGATTPEATPPEARPAERRPSIGDPLADRGGADHHPPAARSEPPRDGKPDWERD